jgi:hypothetical protein
MERIKVSKFFYLDELVDPQTYFFEFDNGLSKLDSQLFPLLDYLREQYNKPLTVNNWWSAYEKNKDKSEVLNHVLVDNSVRKYSGFRSKFCTIGAVNSAHRKGKGIDIKGNPKELYELIKNNATTYYNMGLRRLEDITITTTWLHLDTWNKNNVKGIEVVDLKRVVRILPI